MAFLNKGRSVAVVEEVSYAAATPTFADADYIDYVSADISTDIALIERNVVRNQLTPLESLLGQETSSGSIGIEITAAVTGVVNGGDLYKNAFGKTFVQAVATTATAGTTSTVTVTSAAGMSIGQVIRVNLDVANTEYVQIAGIAGSVLTVTPEFSQAPTNGDAVQALTTYVLNKPNDTVPSLAIRENLKPTSGSPIDYEYLGVVCGSVDLDYPVGNVATATFNIAGAGFTYDATGTTPTLPCTVLTAVVGKNATIKVGATSYTAQDLKVSVANDVTDIQGITTDGITNKIIVGKKVTGSFRVEFTSTAEMQAFKDGTKASLTMLLKDGGKTSPVIHGVVAPQIKFTKVGRSEDGSVLYTDVEFETVSPDCGVTDRSISVFFA